MLWSLRPFQLSSLWRGSCDGESTRIARPPSRTTAYRSCAVQPSQCHCHFRFRRSIRYLSVSSFFFSLRIFIWARCTTYSATSFSGTMYFSENFLIASLSPLTSSRSSNYFGHENSARLTWRSFHRCSSSCINGLISPRREVHNMWFIWLKVWPIPKLPRKIISSRNVVRKISFQTMVLARNLDTRQSRYRHSKTVDFMFFTWTLLSIFYRFAAEKRKG